VEADGFEAIAGIEAGGAAVGGAVGEGVAVGEVGVVGRVVGVELGVRVGHSEHRANFWGGVSMGWGADLFVK